MKAGLMFPDRDFDPHTPRTWNETALAEDLELETLLRTMAQDDVHIHAVCRTALLTGLGNSVDTIRYRQDVVRDCLANAPLIKELYEIADEAVNTNQDSRRSSLARDPEWVVRWAIGTIEGFLDTLERLRRLIEAPDKPFQSVGLTQLSAAFTHELDAEYCASVRRHLAGLRLRDGMLLGVRLGKGNKGSDYVLLEPPGRREAFWLFRFPWLIRLLERITGLEYDPFSFNLDPLDSGNAQTLSSLKSQGLAVAAAALGESAEHIRNFLTILRAELAFHVGCVNLHEQLSAHGEPICFPAPGMPGTGAFNFKGLYDPALALRLGHRVVGNDLDAEGSGLIFVTGANQGGKSTFLRSVGLAQLMMQCGMFAAAVEFHSSVVHGLATHFRREEDAAMQSGKLDEELGRMSEIIDHIAPAMMILFNESFAATGESEGSEIAGQIMSTLKDSGVRMISVTHLYELTRQFMQGGASDVMFLRAERGGDGSRSFRVVESDPLPSSFAIDLYDEIFADAQTGTKNN